MERMSDKMSEGEKKKNNALPNKKKGKGGVGGRRPPAPGHTLCTSEKAIYSRRKIYRVVKSGK